MTKTTTYLGGRIFDGHDLHDGQSLTISDGILTHIGVSSHADQSDEVIDLQGDILSPGYVDLQVNGGDGVMLNDDPSVATVSRIAAAHRQLGATTILPTLITDTVEKSRAAIEAVRAAVSQNVAGIAGLHLEGPHMDPVRKGAHDAALIRPITSDDIAMLTDAARHMPVLKMTLAPESATPDQVHTLTSAGVLVSLGHSNASFETCLRYAEAGATCVTHLFNAMSQIANRDPGMVGAALASSHLSAGLIADGIHVHPSNMRMAFLSKTGPGRIYLVSDAMAPAGTDMTEFELGGRKIKREHGRLTLQDGTLAGADLDLTTAIRVLVNKAGIGLAHGLRAATSAPAFVAGFTDQTGSLSVGKTQDIIRIKSDLTGVTLL